MNIDQGVEIVYSVFLVEDESLIRRGIKNLIEWNEYGFEFAGEAQDGELAWPLIQKTKPDIVITDIKMPFMDGLALSKLIRKELPDTTIIILSGYDDFTYAKEAIAIGVSRYLLKPLSKEQLTEALCQIREMKDKEQEQKNQNQQFSKEIAEYLSNSKRGFWDALVSGKYSVTELLERAQRLKFDLMAENYNIVLLLLEEIAPEQYQEESADVYEKLEETFENNEQVMLFRNSVDTIAFLIKCDASQIDMITNACMEEVKEICGDLSHVLESTLVKGNPVTRLSKVAQCYRVARRKLFHIDESVGDEKNGNEFNPAEMDAGKVDQHIVEKFLSSGLPAEVSDFVKDYFESIGHNAMESLILRQYVVLQTQFTVKSFIKKVDRDKDNWEQIRKKVPGFEIATASMEDAKDYMMRLILYALSIRDQTANYQYNCMLKNVLEYMSENYNKTDINLNKVAKIANVSPTHFSAVFSQQMGKTFVEYLTELRMEEAKKLLRCSDKSSGEIAYLVGYNDPHYFSYIFKKVNGCSPRDYRAGRNGS